jgi:O-antigen/teichoic acid export membrane protein
LVSFTLIARGLELADFGALALIVTYVGIAIRVCNFQSWQALINHASGHAAHDGLGHVGATFRLGFTIDLLACVIAAIFAYVLAPFAAELFNWRDELEAAAQLYALVAVVSITGTPTAVLRFYDRFNWLAWHQVLAALIKLVFTLIVFVSAPRFETFLWAWMGAHVASHVILTSLGLAAMAKAQLFSPDGRSIPMADVATRSMWRFLMASNVDGTLRVVRDFDVQLVAMFIDESAAGLLRIGRQLAAFVGRIVDAFFYAIYPSLTDLAANGEFKTLHNLVMSSSWRVGLFALVPLVLFAAVGEPLLALVFGEAYRDAFGVTLALLLGMAVWGFAQPFAPAVLSVGRAWSVTSAHFIAACVYLFLIVTLVPTMSVVGAGIAMLGLYIVWGLLVAITYRTYVPRHTVAV